MSLRYTTHQHHTTSASAHLLIWLAACEARRGGLDLELVLSDHLTTSLIRQVPLQLQDKTEQADRALSWWQWMIVTAAQRPLLC
jgi:hypothetical protein